MNDEHACLMLRLRVFIVPVASLSTAKCFCVVRGAAHPSFLPSFQHRGQHPPDKRIHEGRHLW